MIYHSDNGSFDFDERYHYLRQTQQNICDALFDNYRECLDDDPFPKWDD